MALRRVSDKERASFELRTYSMTLIKNKSCMFHAIFGIAVTIHSLWKVLVYTSSQVDAGPYHAAQPLKIIPKTPKTTIPTNQTLFFGATSTHTRK